MALNTVKKMCPRCKRKLSLDMFKADRSRPDGRDYVCKQCREVERLKRKMKLK